MTLALGLMSGTSGDGVSSALADFNHRSFKLLAYRTFPYPQKIRKKILHPFELKINEISELDFDLGKIFAEAAKKLLRRAGVPSKKVKVIGSHGQTLYHGPNDPTPNTFQIGEAAILARQTGIPVVNDFRPQDLALGGEGAPLVPFFDDYFYGNGPVRAFQNIGGIANVTVVGKSLNRPVAFDNGPGNSLMDLAIQKITKGRLSYDPSGKWAAKGKVDHERVRAMMKHPYFKRRPPKSTGREEFGEEFLKKYFQTAPGPFSFKGPGTFNLLATLTYFTAFTIYDSLRRFVPHPLHEMIVSGGGSYNRTLMKNLRELFSPTPVRTLDEFGIPSQAKEPLAFAFFALRALTGKINHLPSATGAKRQAVLGKITHA